MNTSIRVLLLILLLFLPGCSQERAGVFQGYIEGEYVYVAAPVGGQLQELLVSRGDPVQAGQRLFNLDPEPEQSALREAEQRVIQAEARLANLAKGLRPSEIAALEARVASATADAGFAESELKRFTRLEQESVISPDEMDRARTRRDAALATAASLKADLETAGLGGREDEIVAAQAEAEAVQASLARSQWAVQQKHQDAPSTGVVQDTLYRVGEWVVAGRPVVSLLPPENLKVRFFVPEPELSTMQQGVSIEVSVDGAPGPLTATVNYISTQAEFTPPVIYSRENRAKLVYMIEADFSPQDAANLHPGQPVDVRRVP